MSFWSATVPTCYRFIKGRNQQRFKLYHACSVTPPPKSSLPTLLSLYIFFSHLLPSFIHFSPLLSPLSLSLFSSPAFFHPYLFPVSRRHQQDKAIHCSTARGGRGSTPRSQPGVTVHPSTQTITIAAREVTFKSRRKKKRCRTRCDRILSHNNEESTVGEK